MICNITKIRIRSYICASSDVFLPSISSFSVYVASSFCAHMVLFGRFKGRSCKPLTRTDSRLSYSESYILSVRYVLGCTIAIFGSVLHFYSN